MSDEISPIEYNKALEDFKRERTKARLQHLWASITGKSKDLLQYDEITKKLHSSGASSKGVRDIPVDAIVGSVNRYQDFDIKFLPLRDNDMQRWARVKSAPEDIDTNLVIREQGEALVREMGEQVREASLAAEAGMARFNSLYDILDEKRSILESTPSIRPTTGWVSSHFGARTSPFTGRNSFHKGYDIANHAGTPIVAPADGVVTYAGSRGTMGIMISIDHGHGMVTRYGHLSKTLKKRGEKVKRGDKIALMGNTGRSTGPHLHYEVRLNGMPVNPEKYILD